MTTTHILGDNVPRKSNFDPLLAEKLTRYYAEHPEELEKPVVPLAPMETTKQSTVEYILMPHAANYALGIDALLKQCVKEQNQKHPLFKLEEKLLSYRPNTFKENCLAKLHQFNTLTNPNGSQRTLKQRTEFIWASLDSCGGLAYPAAERKSTKFKLILQSPELIGIPKDFDGQFYHIDYAPLTCTRELDRNDAKYNQQLTPDEIDSHEGWLTLFEDDKTALRDYRQAVGDAFELTRSNDSLERYMAFWLCAPSECDKLRPISSYGLGQLSYAIGDFLLSHGSFLIRKA